MQFPISFKNCVLPLLGSELDQLRNILKYFLDYCCTEGSFLLPCVHLIVVGRAALLEDNEEIKEKYAET